MTVTAYPWTHDRLRAQNWLGTETFVEAQVKYDGFRLTFFKQADGRVLAFGADALPSMEYTTRYPHAFSSMKHALEAYDAFPRMSSIDGELWVPGHRASEVTACLADRKRRDQLRYTAFACPVWDGRDESLRPISFARDLCQGLGLEFAVSWPMPMNLLDLKRTTQLEILTNIVPHTGGEGFVFKTYNAARWYKWKPTPTVDCVIIGVKDGRGKFAGQVGSLEVAVHRPDGSRRVVASVGGMDDDTRALMTTMLRAGELYERVVEVKYQYIGAGGRLRHPRFERFRDDKRAAECLESQLEA